MDLVSRSLFLFFSFLLPIGFGGIPCASAADVGILVKPETRAFTPQQIKVKLGDKVIWSNQSGEDHFLTSAGGISGPGVMGVENLMIHKLLHPDMSHSYTFDKPDTYLYFCAIHMDMGGTVIVE